MPPLIKIGRSHYVIVIEETKPVKLPGTCNCKKKKKNDRIRACDVPIFLMNLNVSQQLKKSGLATTALKAKLS